MNHILTSEVQQICDVIYCVYCMTVFEDDKVEKKFAKFIRYYLLLYKI